MVESGMEGEDAQNCNTASCKSSIYESAHVYLLKTSALHLQPLVFLDGISLFDLRADRLSVSQYLASRA